VGTRLSTEVSSAVNAEADVGSGPLALMIRPIAPIACNAQVRVFADPLRKIWLRLSHAGLERAVRLKQHVTFLADARVCERAEKHDQIDHIHARTHPTARSAKQRGNGDPPPIHHRSMNGARQDEFTLPESCQVPRKALTPSAN
jgi:hypothetical protein